MNLYVCFHPETPAPLCRLLSTSRLGRGVGGIRIASLDLLGLKNEANQE
jgi:hypothetical protein